MSVVAQIKSAAVEAINQLYKLSIAEDSITVNETKPEFEGDYTLVLFTFIRQLKKSPEAIGNELGKQLTEQHPLFFTNYNVIKGFLNLTISTSYCTTFLGREYANTSFGKSPSNGRKIMVEYSSPNTNKPLHLGHLRNNFLGWSIAEILKTMGNAVTKSCIVNDRGIHICKSMIAWQKHANGATPESTNIKGDHLVGIYYVKFEEDLKIEAEVVFNEMLNKQFANYPDEVITKATTLLQVMDKNLQEENKEKHTEVKAELKELARNNTPVMKEAKEMLLKWEQGDEKVISLWKEMNSWVYKGFDETYKTIGTDFDKVYYESNTYLLGKNIVEQGLQKEVMFKKEDGSVWIDLTADGLDEKLVLRKDGTSVYITQDIGLALQKVEQFGIDESIYVIADEQNYHMKVLKLIMHKLGEASAEGIRHCSYGMVELPSGKMKSREGTVVDADELVAEMKKIAAEKTQELGKVAGFEASELEQLYHMIGLGALKFFLLRVDPKKRMVFNPQESIEFHGFTGPFIQYTHARIKSMLRKAQPTGATYTGELFPLEKSLILLLEQFPAVIKESATGQDPSKIAIYVFNLAQTFNSFYTKHSVLNAEDESKKELRLQLSLLVSTVIKTSMNLLGIEVPEKM